jgi:hypothetical protein
MSRKLLLLSILIGSTISSLKATAPEAIGQTTSLEGVRYNITEYRALKSFGGIAFGIGALRPPSGGVYVRVCFSMTNYNGDAKHVDFSIFRLVDTKSGVHKPIPFFETGENGGASAEHGMTAKGSVLFEVSESDIGEPLTFFADDGGTSSDRLVLPAPQVSDH